MTTRTRRRTRGSIPRALAVGKTLLLFVFGAALALVAGRAPEPALSDADEARLRKAAELRASALAEMEDGNFEGASERLHALAEILPDNILPPINLAICYYRLGERAAALEQIRRARALDSDNPQMLYTLARLLEFDRQARQLWTEVIDHFAATRPRDPRPHYLRGLEAAADERHGNAVAAFGEALRRAPDNLVLMVERLVAAAAGGDLEATGDAVDAIEDRLNGFEGSVADFAEELRDLLDSDDTDAAALPPLAQILRNLLRPTDLYQLGLVPLTGGRGSSGALFPQLDFDPPLPKSIQGGQDIEVSFVQATSESGLERSRPEAVALYRRADRDELVTVGPKGVERWMYRAEGLAPQALELHPAASGSLLSIDVDQDGLSDLVVADPRLGVLLYRGSDSTYETGEPIAAAEHAEALEALLPLDVDHDGDLDLFLARRSASDVYLQNNGDGSWTERAEALGLAGPPDTTHDLASADFDEDGDLDLVVVHAEGHPRLYLNSLAGAFEDASGSFGLEAVDTPLLAVEASDFSNDGLFDLLLWGPSGGRLLLNAGATFESHLLAEDLQGGWRSATAADLDNDGDQDVAVVGASTGELLLLRNRRSGFTLEPTGLVAEGVEDLTVGDFDDDGDLDLVPRLSDGRLLFWRNEGGNRNQWVKLRLRGIYDNNAKNNTQGLFARLEVRVGDELQALLGNGGVNHIGLGAARQADVIRVVWTNGLPQTWLQVASRQSLVEDQVLKGSCPFLYTWNGEAFTFLTDLMWRSTLGMWLADGSRGSHASARDFVLVPGEALSPAGGALWLQITEELWETVYVDHLELLAVDRPAELELLVDERFTYPPFASAPPLHWVERQLEPTAAVDQSGREVLPQVLQRDGRYVDALPLGRYQGLTHGHSLELTFESVPSHERLRLLLWGWIFPTDSSINFALSQSPERQLQPPRLELQRDDGSWQTLLPFLGFPNGKRKAMVVDLSGQLPAGRVTLRIATSMQIYWDAARLAVGDPRPEAEVTRLEPAAADLHYRGFSRLYRESPSSPHLFDYQRVAVGPHFRDMRGSYTDFGPVRELLLGADDRYVIMNAGDEMTVRFDAGQLPPLPIGWRRDFVLYTDGWVKDADLHTSFSRTVEPLPRHAMTSYTDADHDLPTGWRRSPPWFEPSRTRPVDGGPFRGLMRRPDVSLLALQGLDLAPRAEATSERRLEVREEGR